MKNSTFYLAIIAIVSAIVCLNTIPKMREEMKTRDFHSKFRISHPAKQRDIRSRIERLAIRKKPVEIAIQDEILVEMLSAKLPSAPSLHHATPASAPPQVQVSSLQ